MNRRFSLSTPARVIAVVAIIVSMFAIPSGIVSAGAPTLQKRLAAAQPDQNADGTFPSGSIVVYEVSIGCNAVSGSNDCNGFELHDLTPSFTDVDGLTAYYEFQAASGAGPASHPRFHRPDRDRHHLPDVRRRDIDQRRAGVSHPARHHARQHHHHEHRDVGRVRRRR